MSGSVFQQHFSSVFITNNSTWSVKKLGTLLSNIYIPFLLYHDLVHILIFTIMVVLIPDFTKVIQLFSIVRQQTSATYENKTFLKISYHKTCLSKYNKATVVWFSLPASSKTKIMAMSKHIQLQQVLNLQCICLLSFSFKFTNVSRSICWHNHFSPIQWVAMFLRFNGYNNVLITTKCFHCTTKKPHILSILKILQGSSISAVSIFEIWLYHYQQCYYGV